MGKTYIKRNRTLFRRYMNEPKAWRRLQKHKRRRSCWREMKHNLIANKVDYDNQAHILDTKPWIYYW